MRKLELINYVVRFDDLEGLKINVLLTLSSCNLVQPQNSLIYTRIHCQKFQQLNCLINLSFEIKKNYKSIKVVFLEKADFFALLRINFRCKIGSRNKYILHGQGVG